MKKTIYAFALLLVTGLFFSCSDDDNNVEAPVVIEDKGNTVKIAENSTFGKVLTDSKGITLYFFTNDVKGTSECSGGCIANWPIFHTDKLTLDAGLNSADFSTITRADGKKQTTYKGWPLYYFKSDTQKGDTKGDKVGNVWFVAKPDYSLMYANTQLVGKDGKNYKSDYTEGTGLTKYITNSTGRTIYAFTKDSKNKNNFTKADLSNNGAWPVLEIDVTKIPSNLNTSDFGTITVHGKKQVTFKGWPLYYFGGDSNRGENKGVSVPSPGVWPVVNVNTEPAVESKENTVKLAENNTFGKVLTDSKGMTLYFFANDVKGVSECSGGCLDNWPTFHTDELTLDAGLDSADFSTITRADGKKQTTYKGWPLYYFKSDTQEGDINGDKVGNVWFVAKPDYSLMYANTQLVGKDGKNYKSDYTEGTGLTKYITNSKGRTIYAFTKDSKNKNNFTKADLSNNGVWPVLEIDVTKIPSNLNASDFGTITVHGKKQVTFKGWPLYYYGGDTKRGENKGVSVPSPGVWPVVNIKTQPAQQ